MSENKTLAIIALIVSFLLPVVGLIIGIVALNKINKSPEKEGKTLAIIAIIIGLLLTLIIAFLLILPMFMYYNVLRPVSQPIGLSETSGETQSQIEWETQIENGKLQGSATIPTIANPSTGRCLFPMGFRCEQMFVSEDKVSFVLKNEYGQTLDITEVLVYQIEYDLDGNSETNLKCKTDIPIELEFNNYILIEAKNCNLNYDGHAHLPIEIKHITDTRYNYTWTVRGTISARFY